MTQPTECGPVGDRKGKPKPKAKPIPRCRKTPDLFEGPAKPPAKGPARATAKAGAKQSRTRK